MRDQLAIGAVCVGAFFVLVLPANYGRYGAAAKSGAATLTPPAAPSPPKKLTDEDYYAPLDTWLKKQGSPLSGRDAFEVGRQEHIDPDVLIAITYAETSLGRVRQRGSAFNVGSVCSYDATATTCQAGSYRQGFELIAQTLNNPLLRRYTKVSELSRARNFNGPVYATSPENWERNVIGTVNALKGKQETDYLFRK